MNAMSTAELDALVAEATVDCHDEDEQASGLYTMIADNLSLPFTTTVLGVEATVADVDLTGRGEILAICRRGRFEQAPASSTCRCRNRPPRARSGSKRMGTGPAEAAGAPTMATRKRALPPKRQAWADARRRHRLSQAHVQMARELRMNPTKLGKLDNHCHEPWKVPLPQYIERLHVKRFGQWH
jgi:hypothetical protein